MSAIACGRCAECDGGRGAQFCLSPRGAFRLATLDEATTPSERLRQMAPELLAALVQLVADLDEACHSEDCGRTGECDDAADAGEECSYCALPGCPPCNCGVSEWQAHAAAARAAIARATGVEP